MVWNEKKIYYHWPGPGGGNNLLWGGIGFEGGPKEAGGGD